MKKNEEEKTISTTEHNISTIGLVLIFLIGFSPAIIIAINTYYKANSLKENGEYTNAIIYDLNKCGKKHRYSCIYYNYIVDDIEYKGSASRHLKSDSLLFRKEFFMDDTITFMHKDTFSIGDAIKIIYDKTNPAYSKAKRIFDTDKWWRR